MSLLTSNVVIIANGKFPEHPTPLGILANADVIVCCDGAIEKVDKHGYNPTAIVGDFDSVSEELRAKYSNKLFHDSDQETNDLTKAIKWCVGNGHNQVSIIGATGLREDHTLGNIGLLPSYARMGVEVKMFTDHGFFTPLLKPAKLESFKGQQVSIFSTNNQAKITTTNLRYPITERSLDELWMGTLNESLGDWFRLDFGPGSLIIFQEYI